MGAPNVKAGGYNPALFNIVATIGVTFVCILALIASLPMPHSETTSRAGTSPAGSPVGGSNSNTAKTAANPPSTEKQQHSRPAAPPAEDEPATPPEDNNAPPLPPPPPLPPLRGADRFPPTYDAAFQVWLREEVGDAMATALYDPLILAKAAVLQSGGGSRNKAGSNSTESADIEPSVELPGPNAWFRSEEMRWNLGKRGANPSVPQAFATIDGQLLTLKRMLSIGLGRLHRDSAIRARYENVLKAAAGKTPSEDGREGDQSVRAALELHGIRSATKRFIAGYRNQLVTVTQLAFDAMDENSADRRALKRAGEQAAAVAGSLDPLIAILQRITFSTSSEADVKKVRETVVESNLSQKSGTAASANKAPSGGRPFYNPTIDYARGGYDRQGLITGKFWTMIRPTLGCASTIRLCEIPDGCRLLCNPEYLLHAGGTAAGRHYHRFVGFGSNNEYEWEESLVRLFNPALAADSNAKSAGIGWITTFDCTLKAGRWYPPDLLTTNPVGFGHASKCLDERPSSQSLSMDQVKPFIMKSEATFAQAPRKPESEEKKDVRENGKAGGGSAPPELAGVVRYPSAAAGAASTSHTSVFDDVSVLKVDIEGYEFVVAPSWHRGELQELGAAYSTDFAAELEKADGKSAAIDVSRSDSRYFSVSVLQTEFHRMGHKYKHGSSRNGALRAHYLLLHYYALGFAMVANEKNHADNCCFEIVMVSGRHYVRSEAWMPLDSARGE